MRLQLLLLTPRWTRTMGVRSFASSMPSSISPYHIRLAVAQRREDPLWSTEGDGLVAQLVLRIAQRDTSPTIIQRRIRA